MTVRIIVELVDGPATAERLEELMKAVAPLVELVPVRSITIEDSNK